MKSPLFDRLARSLIEVKIPGAFLDADAGRLAGRGDFNAQNDNAFLMGQPGLIRIDSGSLCNSSGSAATAPLEALLD